MKPDIKNPSRTTNASLLVVWIIFLFITLITLGAFIYLVTFTPAANGWNSQLEQIISQIVPQDTQPTPTKILIIAVDNPTITATPFQPLPTSTPTPIPSPTPLPTETPVPTATPEPTEPPPPEPPSSDSVLIQGIYGFPQTFMLDCESRSSVDWARYFGTQIDELEFLYGLPTSDDPNIGFVGGYNDFSGQIPPNSYGVHAAPIAAHLRAYGLPAVERYGYSFDDLKQELNQGDPVIAWIIYGITRGWSTTYTTSAGNEVLVAPNEHTVIVIGYDPYGVTILDGAMVYWRSTDDFLVSWGVLGNMAVIYDN